MWTKQRKYRKTFLVNLWSGRALKVSPSYLNHRIPLVLFELLDVWV